MDRQDHQPERRSAGLPQLQASLVEEADGVPAAIKVLEGAAASSPGRKLLYYLGSLYDKTRDVEKLDGDGCYPEANQTTPTR